MSDQCLIDARLAILARYREAGKGERFYLWFSYPGERDGFEAIDRATDGYGNPLLEPAPARVRQCRAEARRRWCSPCLMFRPTARAPR